MEAQHRVDLQTFRATVSFLTNSQFMTWSCRCPASPCHSAACLQRSCVRILVRPQKIVPRRSIRPPVVRAVLSSAFPCRRENVLRAALRRHRELNCRAASIQASQRYDNPIRIPDHGSYRAASSLRSSCPSWCYEGGSRSRAANAYREVIKLRPDISEAFGGLGRILARLGLVDLFDAALTAVLARSPAPARRTAGNPPASHGRRAARQNDSVSV